MVTLVLIFLIVCFLYVHCYPRLKRIRVVVLYKEQRDKGVYVFTCRTASGELITVQNFPDLRIGKSEKQTNDLAAFVQVGKKYDLVVYEPRSVFDGQNIINIEEINIEDEEIVE